MLYTLEHATQSIEFLIGFTDNICNVPWYLLSVKDQKSILIILRASHVIDGYCAFEHSHVLQGEI
jgi:hypothetical protein